MSVDTLTSRFWAKVDRVPAGCWVWTGARFVQGYGKLFIGRNAQGNSLFAKAHRLAWELANGQPVPDGLGILHSCDNPPCVNPSHLRPGTAKENAEDRAQHGRNKYQSGEASSSARLTESQVRAIMHAYHQSPRRSQSAIAQDFGVGQAHVSRIVRRVSWSHLWDE